MITYEKNTKSRPLSKQEELGGVEIVPIVAPSLKKQSEAGLDRLYS